MTSHESLKNSLFSREFLFFVEKIFDKTLLIYIIKPSKFLKGEKMEAFVYLSIFGITAALLAIFDFLLEKHQEED